jgi:hypothetical protein
LDGDDPDALSPSRAMIAGMSFLGNILVAGAVGVALAFSSAARADDTDGPPITVRPHLQGADGLRLEQRGRGHDEWLEVCDAPCDRSVPLDGTYRVAGPDLVTSNDFQLHGPVGERINVTVDPTTTERRETGKGILIGGVVALGTGLTLATVYAAVGLADGVSNAGCDLAGSFGASTSTGVSASGSATCGHASAPKALLWTSVGALVLGVGGMVAGLVVMEPTRAKQAPVVDVDQEPADRWTPPPQVNGPASFLPPPTMTPLVSGTF